MQEAGLYVEDAATTISTFGDSVVVTDGTLVEAVNLGQSTTRTVNGVSFDGNPKGDDFVGVHDSANVYTDGNVSGQFETLLDSFAFRGSPGTTDSTLTVNDLTVGSEYLLQLFVTDDRNTNTQNGTRRSTLATDARSAPTNSIDSRCKMFTGRQLPNATAPQEVASQLLRTAKMCSGSPPRRLPSMSC